MNPFDKEVCGKLPGEAYRPKLKMVDPPIVRKNLNRYIFRIKKLNGETMFGFGPSPAACREDCKQIPLLYFICEPLKPQEIKDANQI